MFVFTHQEVVYRVPADAAENTAMLHNAFPSDVWVNTETAKRMPVYVRSSEGLDEPEAAADESDDEEATAKAASLPNEVVAVCSFLLRQMNPKSSFKQLQWCRLDVPFSRAQKQLVKTRKLDSEVTEQIAASKSRSVVDFEEENIAFRQAKTKQNSQQFHQNKKADLDNSRAYREIAEQKRKGYSDLFDADAMQGSSNQDRGEDWEDDFM